ncbi:MAG: hypothetical protein AAF423_11745 [Pseudomonadota bacterium]
MKWSKSAFFFAMSLFAFSFSSPEPAQARCLNTNQFPVAELEASVFRQILLTGRDEIQRFFNFSFREMCLDDEEWGAYYDVRSNTLVIGTEFILQQANPPGNINSVLAILAHEAAHAFQNKHGLLNMLVETNPHRVKCIELHADFLAGSFMGWRAERYQISGQDLSKMFYRLGDKLTGADGHHGLGAERFVSFRKGFNTVVDSEITLSSMGIAYVSQTNCDS